MNSDVSGPLRFYTRNAQEQRAAAQKALARYNLCWKKIFTLGLIAAALCYLSYRARSLPAWTPLVVLPVAISLGKQTRRALDDRWRSSRLREYYETGIARLTRNWELLDDGRTYLDDSHFYARDLDVFGPGSMFQLLCSARTQAGRDTLAGWLKAPASREEAQARQAAIAELRERQDLRESVALAGETIVSDFRLETFEAWLGTALTPFPSWAPSLALLLACSVVSLPILFWTGALALAKTDWLIVVVLALEGSFAWLFFRQVKIVMESVRLPSIELAIVGELFRILERERFSSPKLVSLGERLRQRGRSASRETARLERLLRLLDQQRNDWFTLLSYFLLWRTQFSMAIDRWRLRHGPAMRDWLAALGEFEALLSLATYAFEHPGDPFPELVEQGPVFQAEGLAHPLLDAGAVVRNDVQLGDAVRFLIVSGSNMSGKSTFLRAIGLNAALAWMGAPVRCAKLRISPLQVGAAVRVEDSVVNGRSHFLAEIERLRLMIESAGVAPLLFLADEILSGTNSHDRRITAEWVVRALVARGALGVITTHDLALTEIASDGLPGLNLHFTDTGGPDTLDFDYKLRPGLLHRSNALHIARMLGIEAQAAGPVRPQAPDPLRQPS